MDKTPKIRVDAQLTKEITTKSYVKNPCDPSRRMKLEDFNATMEPANTPASIRDKRNEHLPNPTFRNPSIPSSDQTWKFPRAAKRGTKPASRRALDSRATENRLEIQRVISFARREVSEKTGTLERGSIEWAAEEQSR